MSRTRNPLRRLAVTAAIALTLAACGGTDQTSAPTPAPDAAPSAPEGPSVDPVLIVATTSILGDVVAQLVGDDGEVRVLMAPGVDPHGYQASAADAAAMREADLVVQNGLQLEEGLIAAVDAAIADGVRVLDLAPELDPIPFEKGDEHDDHGDEHDDHSDEDHDDHGDEHDDHSDEDHDDHGDEHDDHSDEDHDDHAHGEFDPHFWFDPLRMADGVDLIATALGDIRPEIDWAARATTYRAELEALDTEITAQFATIPTERRHIITNHDSLGYLADRYGFEIVGTVVPGASTTVETNPQAFAALVDVLVDEGIDVIFAETTDTTTLADQLASEAIGRGDLDVRVVQLYTGALGEPGSGAETYVGMLRTTATLITEALAG